MVPILALRRFTRRRRAEDSPAAVYRRYLTLPAGPMLALIRLAFRLDNALTGTGWAPIGTSLFVLARRGPPATVSAGNPRARSGSPDSAKAVC